MGCSLSIWRRGLVLALRDHEILLVFVATMIINTAAIAGWLLATDRAAGVDLFIGETEHIGPGTGSAILRKFLRSIVFADCSIDECIIGPEAGNCRSCLPVAVTSRARNAMSSLA